MFDLRGGNARVRVLGGGLGRRARFPGLPRAQGAPGGVAGQKEAQGGGARAREPEAEEGRHDLLLVDLGVPGEPLLHFEPVHQEAHDLVGHDALTQLVERRLPRDRVHQDVETLPPGLIAEIV